MIVTFEGGSDDIVCTAIGPSIAKLKREETYVAEAGKLSYARFVVLADRPGRRRGVAVIALYSNTGAWQFSYGLIGDGDQLPPWAFTTEQAHIYSTRLVIDTIDDNVKLIVVEPEPGKEDD